MAIALSLAVILGAINPLRGQSHREDGCNEEGHGRIDSLHRSMQGLRRVENGGIDSVLYINQIKDDAILWHPLITQEEAMGVIQHKQRFGDILDAAELVQCGFSVERIAIIRGYLVFEIEGRWAQRQWLLRLKDCRPSVFMGGRYGWSDFLNLDNGRTAISGYQGQIRLHNSKTFSMGAAIQRDPGEVGKLGVGNWHVRLSDYRRIETLVAGRYSLQLGQGLVQGGLSGFWNAPLVWARRTPDWGLGEKRGWDEYQGHSGLGLALRGGGFRGIVAVSRGRVSARTDGDGRMVGLITDGNFSTESKRIFENNTEQRHITGAVLLGRGIGVAWSGYQYNREWLRPQGWLRPALRAGRNFHYPEVWMTRNTKMGGLSFLHVAMQFSENQRRGCLAAVGGWIKPLGQRTDISFRGYLIQNEFRPPQGLFNQMLANHWSTTATFSSGTTGKRSLRWAAELRQPLLPDEQFERPLYHKQQVMLEKALGNQMLFHCLWQWNNQANLWGWETFTGPWNSLSGSSTTGNPLSTSPFSMNSFSGSSFALNSQNANSPHKITLTLRAQQSKSNTLEHLFSYVPRPHSSQGSYLYALTFIHRKPFSKLKWAAECLFFDSNIPLYFTPQTLPHEITHYTLTQKGIAMNALIQFAFKNPKIHMAARSEIILKNTTENPVQPRIFASLWLN